MVVVVVVVTFVIGHKPYMETWLQLQAWLLLVQNGQTNSLHFRLGLYFRPILYQDLRSIDMLQKLLTTQF